MTEMYSCSLRVKSLPENDAVKMQAGSTESHILFVSLLLCFHKLALYFLNIGHWTWFVLEYSLPDGIGDDLIIEVHDSKGVYCGRAIAQVADISDDQVWYFLELSVNNWILCNYMLHKHYINSLIAGREASLVAHIPWTRAWPCWKSTIVYKLFYQCWWKPRY